MERVLNKRNAVALAILVVALIMVTTFVCVTCSFSYASAEEIQKIDTEYVTGNYYEFGEIIDIATDIDSKSFYTAEIIDDQAWLRIIKSNDTYELVKIENTSVENYRKIEISATAGKVFIKQDDGIYEYNTRNPQGLKKYVDLTYKYSSDGKETIGDYKSFDCAPLDGILVVDYNNRMVFFDASVSADADVGEKRKDSFALNTTNSFDRMVVDNTEKGTIDLHLYDSSNGNRFIQEYKYSEDSAEYKSIKENTQNALNLIDEYKGLNVDLFACFNGGKVKSEEYSGADGLGKVKNEVYLGIDGLYNSVGERVIKISTSSENGASDDYIKKYSRIAVLDDCLYAVDNGQNAVKVYDSEYKLIALYGSYGQGVEDNSNGLTRFISPKLLCGDDEHLALFDEGNARIVVLDTEGNVLSTHSATNVSGLMLLNGVWYSSGKDLICLDYKGEEVAKYTVDGIVQSLTTDGKNVFVKTSSKIFTVKSGKLVEYIEGFSLNGTIIGGKHDGVLYSFDNGIVSMYKDGLKIIECESVGDDTVYGADVRGNLLSGKDNKLHAYFRQLDNFVKNDYTVDINISDVVVTLDGKVFAISNNALVKVNYDELISGETDYETPSIEYPVKSISVNEKCLGYTYPDNYESVVEVGVTSYILFAKTNFEGNDYYYTEVLKNGKFIKVYIPTKYATALPDGNIDNEFIKYGGADAEPMAYNYPSLTASPVVAIEKGRSYKVLRVVSDEWKWYQIDIDGLQLYVNGANYISAEPLYKTVDRYYFRAKADSLGEQITLYADADENSEVIALVGEGTTLELTEPYDENLEFLQVRYNKGIAYVKTNNIQKDGLTEAQRFALYFAGAVVGLTAIFGVLSMLVRRRKPE